MNSTEKAMVRLRLRKVSFEEAWIDVDDLPDGAVERLRNDPDGIYDEDIWDKVQDLHFRADGEEFYYIEMDKGDGSTESIMQKDIGDLC